MGNKTFENVKSKGMQDPKRKKCSASQNNNQKEDIDSIITKNNSANVEVEQNTSNSTSCDDLSNLVPTKSEPGDCNEEEHEVVRVNFRKNSSPPLFPEAVKNIKSDFNNDLDDIPDPDIKKLSFSDEVIEKPTKNIQGIDMNIKKLFNVQLDVTEPPKSLPKGEYELNFYRNSEEIRKSYMEKLLYKRVWNPSMKQKTHNSIIIFDWDDTLLCTSYLTPGGYFDEQMELTEKDKEKISKLEQSAYKVLSIALEKGDVYIITNAGPGWVQFSAQKFYPSVYNILDRVKIISAREEYEAKYPGDSRKWKIYTFLNLQKTMNTDLVTNIICLGDSFIEMDAGRILASKFTQAFVKTVKFRESPKPEELNKQLTLVAVQFNSIVAAVKNLTVRVEKKKK